MFKTIIEKMFILAPTVANTPLERCARLCGGVVANGEKQMGSK
ncbi:MAG: hypothetical protein WEA59_03525 [Ferruginibacter sp.]